MGRANGFLRQLLCRNVSSPTQEVIDDVEEHVSSSRLDVVYQPPNSGSYAQRGRGFTGTFRDGERG